MGSSRSRLCTRSVEKRKKTVADFGFGLRDPLLGSGQVLTRGKAAALRTRWLVLSTIVLFIATVIAISSVGGGTSAPQSGQYVREHPVSVPSNVRTVRISSTMPMPSAHPRRLSSMLEQGVMPRHATTGEVLSDTECAPDRDSISHCRNEVRLPDGDTIVLRHPHRMADVPCLAPGETVRLLPPSA